MDILVLNSGSSSLKYKFYKWEEKMVIAKGIVERVTMDNSFIIHEVMGNDKIKIQRDCPTHKEAIDLIIEMLTNSENGIIDDINRIDAIGHRVVHGGEKFNKSVIINDTALNTFKQLSGLAPLHNPPNIMGIEAAKDVLPDIPHVAIMDTAWHQTMPKFAYIYALPYEWYSDYSIRKYGFHGTSLLYVAKRASALLGKKPFETDLILAHIGNGVSFNAVKDGVSIDTSMGFTPLEGAVMGTRAGDHDAAIDFYMMKKLGVSGDEMCKILNKNSGLLGITGRFIDRRDIQQAAKKGDELSKLAIDIEGYRGKKYIGSYMASLGSVDAIVFTAGVGEMSPLIRRKMLEGLENIGIILDIEKNDLSKTRNAETEITGKGSKIRIFVIPTDEELVMTEDTVALIEGRYDVHTNFTYSFQSPDYVNKLREDAFKKDLEKNPGLSKVKVKIPI